MTLREMIDLVDSENTAEILLALLSRIETLEQEVGHLRELVPEPE